MISKRRGIIAVALVAALISTSMVYRSLAGSYFVVPHQMDIQVTKNPSTRNITNRVFMLLKTGVEVAYDRIPAHAVTTLQRYPTSRVYADANYSISGVQIIDSLALLDNETLNSDSLMAYRIRRQSQDQLWNWGNKDILIGEDKSGWHLDRFKNIPAFAHAWAEDDTKDWYVMIDADSYVLAHTLEAVTAQHDPDEKIYLGRALGNEPFAHGGSGIILSRGAMLAVFGSTQEQLTDRLREGNKLSSEVCCGDESVAQLFTKITGLPSGTNLDSTDLGQFQGRPLTQVNIPLNEQWCNAITTFHWLKGWEVYRLDKWETDCDAMGLNQTYAQYYNDFIKHQVVSELPNWIFHVGVWDGKIDRMSVSGNDTEEAYEKTKCINKCAETADCMMWTYLSGEACRIFHGVVAQGEKINSFTSDWKAWPEIASGYMVDRIKEFRETHSCGSEVESRPEGWFIDDFKPSSMLEAETPRLVSQNIVFSH